MLLTLQPGNIFIKNGCYKLGDFGLVTYINTGCADILEEGDSKYMSSELLNDGPKDLTKVCYFATRLRIIMYKITILFMIFLTSA